MTTTEQAIIAELKRQGERHHGPYIHTDANGEPSDDLDSFLVDGRLDIAALAAAANYAAQRRAMSARFGSPSSWKGKNPVGWHINTHCTPHDAAMHDNGCHDAARAIYTGGHVIVDVRKVV